ncbi:MAG: folate-binding protein YgfZ [Candidatus Thiodiazotropha sp. (ex Monitilora ramsayi)]|nr:folate-binding protein YgfZ [Candidatus Thiodiazotropha sp. (ex Monitilora ramsayi)]
MNKPWSDFLQTRPIAGDEAQPDCVLNDLSHFGLIKAEDEDVEKFLQGQLTNDMREVTETHSNLAGWCSAKGRMLANFRCFRRNDAYYLQTLRENMESVLKRLGMYILMSKVSLTDVSDELIRVGITGTCAEQILKDFVDNLPTSSNEVAQKGELTVIRLPGDTPRFEVIGPEEALQKLWQKAEISAVRMNGDYWALQDIRAGIPTIYQRTSEAFVPQMTNMQLIDGVSFTKGCYTGQEVVARMQYLGKLKRRMYLAHVETDTPPQPGDELFASDSSSAQGAGKLVDAQPVGNGGYDLLAVIEIDSAEAAKVSLGENGPRLTLKQLPYPFAE